MITGVADQYRTDTEESRLSNYLGRAGRINIHVDRLLWIVILEVQKLCHQKLGHSWNQRHPEVYDAILEEVGSEVRGWLLQSVSSLKGNYLLEKHHILIVTHVKLTLKI